jgi:ribosomal protein L29
MSVVGDLLFYSGRGPGLSDVLRHNLETEVPAKVDRIPASAFDAKSDEELTAAIVEQAKAEQLSLRLDEADGDVAEKPVTVQDVFGGTATIPGLRVTKVIPFDGEAQFFNLQPNTWDMNPPRGEVRGNKLIVGMEVRESESESAVQYIEQTIARVQEQIGRQQGQIDEHNAQLPGVAATAIQRRRASLGKVSDLAARLRGR